MSKPTRDPDLLTAMPIDPPALDKTTQQGGTEDPTNGTDILPDGRSKQEVRAMLRRGLEHYDQVLGEQDRQDSVDSFIASVKANGSERVSETVTQTVPKDHSEEFNWRDDDDVILREQPATAVYFNPRGGLVIRQERAWDQEQDSIIVITKENIDHFLDKLTDACGIPSFGGPSR